MTLTKRDLDILRAVDLRPGVGAGRAWVTAYGLQNRGRRPDTKARNTLQRLRRLGLVTNGGFPDFDSWTLTDQGRDVVNQQAATPPPSQPEPSPRAGANSEDRSR